ncbi:mitochondrial 2-oxodicarboxylate carrier-like [Teleopsis dalmanni]|nr:mitochondrial 2-oxodicarboxylate carrier-like [Teleopsis dalmanni]
MAFYKGILPPMMVEIPKRAVKFMFFEQSIRFFLFGQEKPMPISYILAGVCSGIGEGTVINPFEVVKVQQQAARGKMADSEGAMAVAKRIIAQNGFGLKGISRGYFATVWREIFFNIVYFGVYRSILDVLPVYPEKPKELFKKFICGFSCAILGCLFNTPFDMAKSTLQGPLGMVKYFTIWGTFKSAYADDGLKGVYRGLGPRLLRIGPGGAIMLLVYDQVYGFLYRTFHYAGGP